MVAPNTVTIAWLIETCKLNDVDPLGYLSDVLTRIVNGHPNSDIDQLLPWGLPKDKTSNPWPGDYAYDQPEEPLAAAGLQACRAAAECLATGDL